MTPDWMEEWSRQVAKSSGKSADQLLEMANGNDLDFLFSIEIALQQRAERGNAVPLVLE